jgi:hemoglobin
VHSRHPIASLLIALGVLTALQSRAGSLFEDMGGGSVLHAAVDKFTDLILADPRINFTFAEANLAKFKGLLYDQLCELSGGPCAYGGRDMRTAHEKLRLNTAEFDALAEDLYIALGKCGVPYRLQNRLMAKLAPMKRDIVSHSKAPAENLNGDSRADPGG